MSTYLMFGNYTSESIKQISQKRTEQVVDIVRQFGGEVKAMYALLGAFDIVIIAGFPSMDEVSKVSVVMSQALGITFSTMPALPVEGFEETKKAPQR